MCPPAAVEQAACTPACAARAARAAGLCARMCAAGWTSGLWRRGPGLRTLYSPVREQQGACDAAPAPPAPLQLPALGPGRWPPAYKGILCPGRMTPLCGWRVAGSHYSFLPSQRPARLPRRAEPHLGPSWSCQSPASLAAGASWPPVPAVRALHPPRLARPAGPSCVPAWASAAPSCTTFAAAGRGARWRPEGSVARVCGPQEGCVGLLQHSAGSSAPRGLSVLMPACS